MDHKLVPTREEAEQSRRNIDKEVCLIKWQNKVNSVLDKGVNKNETLKIHLDTIQVNAKEQLATATSASNSLLSLYRAYGWQDVEVLFQDDLEEISRLNILYSFGRKPEPEYVRIYLSLRRPLV